MLLGDIKKLLAGILVLIFPSLFFSQSIKLYSVVQARQPFGDNGYTLDGSWMQGARAKLYNPANFSLNGTYHKSVDVDDAFGTSGSLVDIVDAPIDALLFFGAFDLANVSEPFTDDEIEALYQWSLKGGKVIIASGQVSEDGMYDSRILNHRWGFDWTDGTLNCIPNATGNATTLFHNGPFGSVSTVHQASSFQGYFDSIPANAKVFAGSAIGGGGGPTVFMDCTTLDLIVADVDVYTSRGGISSGSDIANNQDKFWANTIAFMDKLQQPPVLSHMHDTLKVDSVYVNYQWYRDGKPITLATTNSFIFNDFGTYYVETTVNGGCKIRSNDYTNVDTTAAIDNECDLFVPTAFSPDHNGLNEKLCMYGRCFKDIDFKIYDRWGEIIFRSGSHYDCWDGTYKGQPLNSGVYVWSLKATRPSGTKINRKGNITLIR